MIESIAIGAFDGVHIAHQKLIEQVDGVVIIERGNGVLTKGYLRTKYIDNPCFFYNFETIQSLTAKEFIDKLKTDFPELKKIVVGYDFHFGRDKEGDANLLKNLFDGEVDIVDEIKVDDVAVHSRTIKEALKSGDTRLANKLLGREYTIEGEVVRGQGLGAKEIVPTLNLQATNFLLPKEGVYATKTKILSRWYISVSFIGHRLSTDGSFAIESHIIDEDIIGNVDKVEIRFVGFLRDNKIFDSLSALKSQINIDILQAKAIHER